MVFWSRSSMSQPSLLQLATSGGTPRRSLLTALVVGPILTAINQGDAVLAGTGLDWSKALLTFVVPFIVATVGAVQAKRAAQAPSIAVERPSTNAPAAPLPSASTQSKSD